MFNEWKHAPKLLLPKRQWQWSQNISLIVSYPHPHQIHISPYQSLVQFGGMKIDNLPLLTSNKTRHAIHKKVEDLSFKDVFVFMVELEFCA